MVTPGATIAASSSRISATSWFDARIFPISAGDLQTITPGPSPSPAVSAADASLIAWSIAAVTRSGGWLPSIVRNVGRPE